MRQKTRQRKEETAMTFQQLTYLVEVSRCGSINKAAHKLFLSQSGISSSIRELENELGICFFRRSNRGVEFTPEGKEFLSYAVSLLEQKQRIESLYSDHGAIAPARFSVSTQRYPFTEDAFLRMVQQTCDEDTFRFSIKEAGMDMVIQDVYEHQVDLGVIFLTDLTEKIIRRMLDAHEVEFHQLASVPPCLYVRKGHPLTSLETVTVADLAGFPYLSFEHDQGAAVDFSEEYQLWAFKKPARCISVNNRTTAMNLLAATDAFTTGSGLLVRGLADPRVVTVPLAGQGAIRLGWIQARDTRLTPQAEYFVALLEQSVQDSIAYTRELHRSLHGDGA